MGGGSDIKKQFAIEAEVAKLLDALHNEHKMSLVLVVTAKVIEGGIGLHQFFSNQSGAGYRELVPDDVFSFALNSSQECLAIPRKVLISVDDKEEITVKN